MLKQFYRPKTRSSLQRQKLLGCLDGGHFRHEEQDAGLVISAWQHGTCLGCSPRGLEVLFRSFTFILRLLTYPRDKIYMQTVVDRKIQTMRGIL